MLFYKKTIHCKKLRLRNYDENNNLISKSYFTHPNHGVIYEYDSKGRLVFASVLSHNKIIHRKEWHSNGNISKKVNWVNSALHGLCKMWDSAGKICTEKNYNNGKLCGTTKRWRYVHGEHQLASVQLYRDNLLHGLQIYYDTVNNPRYYFSINGDDYTGEIEMIVHDIKNITQEELTLIGLLYGF